MIPNYYEVKIGHGWNKGHIKEKDVICTIDSGIDKWHTLLGEMGVAIKNNNSKGYAIAQSGDGIDISSRMQHHR